METNFHGEIKGQYSPDISIAMLHNQDFLPDNHLPTSPAAQQLPFFLLSLISILGPCPSIHRTILTQSQSQPQSNPDLIVQQCQSVDQQLLIFPSRPDHPACENHNARYQIPNLIASQPINRGISPSISHLSVEHNHRISRAYRRPRCSR